MNKSFFYFIVGAVIPILLIVGIWKWLLGGQLGFHFLPEKKFNIHTEHTEDDEVLLRIAGSNTLGEKIIPEIAKVYLQSKGATQVKIEEDDDEDSKEKTVVGKLNNKNVSIEISHEGTSSGFNALKDDEADMVMASRQINPNEAINLSSYGDMFSHNAEHIIGLDGIAVIVNHSNGLRTLTMEQAAAIFSGKIKSWSELPNSNLSENIKIYVRDSKSGTYEVFNNIVLNGKGVNNKTKTVESNEVLASVVANDINAISFIPYPYVKNAKTLAIQETEKTDAFYPTHFTVATEDYPISRRMYLYIPEKNAKSEATDFVKFALKHEAQEILHNEGFVKVELAKGEEETLAQLQSEMTDAIPAAYKNAVLNAKREPLDFHFKIGSSVLDNKSFDDIERLSALVEDADYRSKQLILLGFTDDQGSDAANLKLAQNRAQAVVDELKKRGIRNVTAKGLGEIMPVASNETNLGRERNRRVEVWVK